MNIQDNQAPFRAQRQTPHMDGAPTALDRTANLIPAEQQSGGMTNVRVDGGLTLAFETLGPRHPPTATQLITRRERDGYKVRTPRGSASRTEAVIINTGGGVAGGDRVAIDVRAAPETRATVTSAQAERIYGTDHPASAQIDIAISIGANAEFAWLPQETILFDTSRLRRRITVELAPTATLLMGELVILGRSAMGETLRTGLFHDQWRIKRDGQLLFAENVRLDGDVAAQLGRKGSAESARSFGTVVAVMPNAELKLAQLRGALTDEPHAAASRIGDMIVARVLAPSGLAARNAVSRVLETLNSDPLPRVWST
jgi:urease accessory protein